MPANSARADEAQESDPGIGRERLGEFVGFGKKNLTPIRRQPVSWNRCTNSKQESGVGFAGLTITGQPVATAGTA
jgi:hypothetical protein